MRWLVFLSRVTFLCGITMLLALSLLFTSWNQDETVSSTIIMAGYGLAILLLPLTNLLYLIFALTGKKPAQYIPRWMMCSNVFLFFIFLLFIFYINDPYYHYR